MKESEIFMNAARMVEKRREEYSCLAVMAFANPLEAHYWWASPTVRKYVSYFVACDETALMCEKLQDKFEAYWSERRNLRVLALCFAAAIAESEGN